MEKQRLKLSTFAMEYWDTTIKEMGDMWAKTEVWEAWSKKSLFPFWPIVITFVAWMEPFCRVYAIQKIWMVSMPCMLIVITFLRIARYRSFRRDIELKYKQLVSEHA